MQQKNCQNCDHALASDDKFCPACGQKNNSGKVTMKQLMKQFWGHFSHLDSKFVKGVWHLFYPARVTIQYFKGKQKQYPQPVQFFFVVMFFFLFFFNKQLSNNTVSFNNTGRNFNFSIGGDSVKADHITGEQLNRAMENSLFIRRVRSNMDSMPTKIQSAIDRSALDSLLWYTGGKDEITLNNIARAKSGTFVDSFSINMLYDGSPRIAIQDILGLSPSEIADQYHINNWADRVLFRQGIRTIRKPDEVIHNYVGSTAWAILCLIALMSGVLALLYWRQRRYYVEHFVFLMHQHSAGFMALTVFLIINKVVPLGPIWLLVMVWIGVHLWLSLRNYYGQGWFVTTLKWVVYLMVYISGFACVFLGSLFLSYLLV